MISHSTKQKRRKNKKFTHQFDLNLIYFSQWEGMWVLVRDRFKPRNDGYGGYESSKRTLHHTLADAVRSNAIRMNEIWSDCDWYNKISATGSVMADNYLKNFPKGLYLHQAIAINEMLKLGDTVICDVPTKRRVYD
jgi:hypothetical protein